MTTNRGDMPAMPQSVAVGPAGDLYTSCYFAEEHGLTIREEFIKAAMQGLLASGRPLDDELTQEAQLAADMQLALMERTK